uniref:DNA replication complex GINS protein SLD5 n=1 Tax=Timema tahoe TaxID=61484 RepID=A0A7R9IR40_9NEOP|nr:unnamed protein product [Timema tahoe]
MDVDSDAVASDPEASEDEIITAQKVLQTLEEAWLNEKFSPELLPHQSDVVECMMEQVQQMEDNIRRLPKGDFRVVVHRLELDRIRYVTSNYLRLRLEKIEAFTAHILERENDLSPGECRFAREYLAHLETHLRHLALRHMPTNIQDLDHSNMTAKPNTNSFVFLRVKGEVSGVVIEGDSNNRDEEIDLETGSQHVMQYRPVAELVRAGSIQLI